MSSATVQTSSSSRSRTQARKRINDDAAYLGPPASIPGPSGTKRHAAEKADGEPRVKRKRVETSYIVPPNGKKDGLENEPRKSLVSTALSLNTTYDDGFLPRLSFTNCRPLCSTATWSSLTLYPWFIRHPSLLKIHQRPLLWLILSDNTPGPQVHQPTLLQIDLDVIPRKHIIDAEAPASLKKRLERVPRSFQTSPNIMGPLPRLSNIISGKLRRLKKLIPLQPSCVPSKSRKEGKTRCPSR